MQFTYLLVAAMAAVVSAATNGTVAPTGAASGTGVAPSSTATFTGAASKPMVASGLLALGVAGAALF